MSWLASSSWSRWSMKTNASSSVTSYPSWKAYVPFPGSYVNTSSCWNGVAASRRCFSPFSSQISVTSSSQMLSDMDSPRFSADTFCCTADVNLQICIRCYEVKIDENEKAISRQELNPGHLWLETPVLCHWAMTAGQPPTLTIPYIYCTGGTECLSHTPGSHSVCAVRTPLGVDQKILSIRKEPMLSCKSQHGFFPDGNI